MNSKSSLIIVGLVCLVIGAAGGYFGRPYIRTASSTDNQFGSRQGGPGGRNGAAGRMFGGIAGQGRPLMGQVITVNSDRFTVKTADGSSHIILLNGNTKYSKVTDGTVNDFTSGTQVIVTGATQSDGTITAVTVQAAPVSGSNTPAPSSSLSPSASPSSTP